MRGRVPRVPSVLGRVSVWCGGAGHPWVLAGGDLALGCCFVNTIAVVLCRVRV